MWFFFSKLGKKHYRLGEHFYDFSASYLAFIKKAANVCVRANPELKRKEMFKIAKLHVSNKRGKFIKELRVSNINAFLPI